MVSPFKCSWDSQKERRIFSLSLFQYVALQLPEKGCKAGINSE